MRSPSHPPRRTTGRRTATTGRTGIAGFTLVEVLVALLVMALMAGMAWRGVDGIVRTRDASQGRLDRTLRMNTVVAQWEQDLAAIQESTVLPQALSCDGATVRLARRTPTGLQIVAWSLRPDPNGGGLSQWVRWAGPPVTTTTELQQSWAHSQQLLDDEPGVVRALTGLSQWQVYFYQTNGWANCQSTGNLVTGTPVANLTNGTAGNGTAGGNVAAAGGGASSASGATGGTGGGTASGGVVNNPNLLPGLPTARIALPSGVRLVLTFAPGSGVEGSLTRDTQVGP